MKVATSQAVVYYTRQSFGYSKWQADTDPKVPSSFNIEIRKKGNNSSLRDSIFKRMKHYVDD